MELHSLFPSCCLSLSALHRKQKPQQEGGPGFLATFDDAKSQSKQPHGAQMAVADELAQLTRIQAQSAKLHAHL